MSKKLRFAAVTFALAGAIAVSASLSACAVKTSHPRAKISISFNEVTYDIEYTLYRNMYPQTVRHFIELADAGFYDNTVIHDYRSNDWGAGAYSYNGAELDYSSSYSNNSMGEYLEENSKEKEYYSLFRQDKLTPTVYTKISYDEKGNEKVERENALPTLIGEFSQNQHTIESGALTASYGSLKMFYFDKSAAKKKVAIQNSFGEIMEHDYQYNCATSLFTMQVGNTSAYNASNYCVFAKLSSNDARNRLEDLTEAISDYIEDELGGSNSKFSSSVTTKVENEDTFATDGGREIETSFTATSMPIIIKSVKITKY